MLNQCSLSLALSMLDGNFRPPQHPNPLTDYQKFGTGMITAPMAVPNLKSGANHQPVWGSRQTGEMYVQSQFDLFNTIAHNLLEMFYPERTVTITSRDPAPRRQRGRDRGSGRAPYRKIGPWSDCMGRPITCSSYAYTLLERSYSTQTTMKRTNFPGGLTNRI